jgi:hypothetical protein
MVLLRRIGFVLLWFVIAVAGYVIITQTSKPQIPVLSPEDAAAHNRAVAHMNRNEVGEAEKILQDLAERYPDHEMVVIDRAIAVMHRHKGGQAAIPLFEAAVNRFPESDRARYGLAYLYQMDAKMTKAAELLKPVAAKIDSKQSRDPHIAYLYGFILENIPGREAESSGWYKKAVELDPYFYTATFRLLSQARSSRQPQNVIKDLAERAANLEKHGFGSVADSKIRRMGPMLDVMPLESRTAVPADMPTGEAFLEPVSLVSKAEWGSAKPSPYASVTVCDINGDGLVDLHFAGANVTVGGKSIPNAVLLQTDDRKFKLAVDHPLALVSDVTAILWGDIDNDGVTDAFLCRHDGNQLWRQNGIGKWEKIDEAKAALGPKGHCHGGTLFDADFDGDLDVVLVYEDGPNELLQNPGNGSFKEYGKALGVASSAKGSRQALPVDLDGDRMLELVLLPKEGVAEFLKPDVKGGFVPASMPQTPKETTAIVARAAPMNGSSKLFRPQYQGSQIRLELADITGDGSLVLFESGDGVVLARSTENEAKEIKLPTMPKAVAWTLANIDPKRGPSLICLPTDGRPPVAAHPGPGRFDFFSMSFIGDKDGKKGFRSNKSGIGVKVCARVRDQWLCQFPLSQSSGPGQSLQPIAIGSRGAAAADFLFIDWPNGDFQSEFSPPIGKTVAIKELDRIPTDSCPLLFAWNGEKFEFITDFLGVGGVDYLVRPGEYFTPTDPVEHLLLPQGCLPANETTIRLKVLEPAEEVTFLDRVSLIRYDLPPGWEMTLDERHSALPPKPTHEPRFFRTKMKPSSVVNEDGVDCTEALAAADLRAAPAPHADHRFVGRFERPHQLTFDFASPIDALKNPTLVMDGWVAFPDAQSVMNAAQAEVSFSVPRLEASGTDGKWTVVYPEFGYPAGMQRQMSLPLSSLPKGCNRLRITHDLEANWDRVMIVDAEPCPLARKTEIKLEVAMLAAVGSPRFDRNRDGKPFWFDYEDRNPFWPVRSPIGRYTRFGDCRELVDRSDDASATIGPGEEVHLEFRTPAAPPTGWTSRFVLESRGWCRGMRLYTRNGSTIEPMPTTGLPAEPRDRLHRRFNTRLVGVSPDR